MNLTVDDWQAEIGAQVRSARIEAGHDQATLAGLSNVSISTVQQLENGRGSSLASLIAVVRSLGKTSWLSSLAPVPTVSPTALLDSGGAISVRRRVSRKGR